jgi:glutathione synthase/RimK-type ligase-like ATP-grasp enzyme
MEQLIKKKIFILTDYEGIYFSKNGDERLSMDLSLIKQNFESSGFLIEILEFADVNFDRRRFANQYVLYQSSEDTDLLYKSYIEDVIYGLYLIGAKVIPRYECLKAHDNKVMMEILRTISPLEEMKTVRSQTFGTMEELNKLTIKDFPLVLKISSGAGSRGVSSIETEQELKYKVKKITRSFYLGDIVKDLVKKVIRKGYLIKSHHRRKYVLQNLIPNLDHDYKVLIYDKKFFVLKRGVRDNDFRASGSGKFSYQKEIPVEILEFSQKIFNYFDVPFISLDVAYVDKTFYLFEFQFVLFGTITLENSPFYFQKVNNDWECIEDFSILENVFSDSVMSYIWKIEKPIT